jgi:transcriptional regulator with XRE-family HTH domain
MLISDLQDRLRAVLSERIALGELTGTELANRAGFQQAHVSNFLNQRRGLSIEAMDRVMEVLRLKVRDLMPVERMKPLRGEGDAAGFEWIPLIERGALLRSEIGESEVVERVRFKKSFLRRLRPSLAVERRQWRRFVVLRVDKESGAGMRPRLLPGATVLIDRHYNTLRYYRRHEPNLYVVKRGEVCQVCYVEEQGNLLALRPECVEEALGFVRIAEGEKFSDYVVGRVAHISIET